MAAGESGRAFVFAGEAFANTSDDAGWIARGVVGEGAELGKGLVDVFIGIADVPEVWMLAVAVEVEGGAG